MLVEIGKCYYMNRKFQKAIYYLENVLAIDPEHVPAFQNLVKVYAKMHAFDKGFEIANKYKKIDPNERLLQLAWLSKQKGSLPEAIHYYQKVLQIDPSHAEALCNLMLSYRKLGKNKEMVDAANALAIVASSEFFFREIVYAFYQANQLDKGLQTLQSVKANHPERDVYIDCEVSTIYQLKDEYEKAEAILLPMIKQSRDRQTRRRALDRLYKTYLYMGKYRKASETCQEIIELFAEMPKRKVKIELRQALIELWGWNDRKSASSKAKAAIIALKSVSSPEYWNHLCIFYLLSGNFNEAKEIYSKKLSQNAAIVAKAISSILQNNHAVADSLRSSVFRDLSGWEKIRILYYFARYHIKEGDKAIEWLYELHKLADNYGGFRAVFYPKSFYLLGMAFEEQGKLNKALENYQAFLCLWKSADRDLPELGDARHRVKALSSGRIAHAD